MMADPPASLGPISVIGASAGTGKTFRLVSCFVDAVNGEGGTAAVKPTEIIATTFTNKAADEVIDRIRHRLIELGEWEAAQHVLTGNIGTVNSVCGRILAEFALDAGLSPVSDVLPEERTSMAFAAAAEPVIDAYMDKLDHIARRLCQEGWRDLVLEITRLARSNGITPEQLVSFAARSWADLQLLLPEPHMASHAARLDAELADAIRQAVSALSSPSSSDSTAATARVLDELKMCAAVLRSGEDLTWRDWAKLSKLSPAKASEPIVNPVKEAASAHPKHPRLHEDLEKFIALIFECAADAMEHYQAYKRELGFMDFTDQEAMALSLLDDPHVCQRLSSRLSLVLVDEFQDTSPIQLAIFLKLAQIAKRSVWVGDEKQAIYGFRDTDPELMRSVVGAVVPQSGGQWDTLARSYRTVPELVKFTNDVFKLAFPPLGIPAKRVTIAECDRATIPDVRNLQAWWLGGDNWEDSVRALALGVAELLDDAPSWPVLDQSTRKMRHVRGGDIAILCRRNERCAQVAAALAELALPVATSRHGLMATPECGLAFACLRYLVDPFDTLAAAEILHFSEGGDGHKTWLVEAMQRSLEQIIETKPRFQRFAAERSHLGDSTPGEALELALTAGGVVDTVSGWTHFRQRLSNLDAMRGLAVQYEELCLARRSAATAAGFVTFLFKELEREGEQPPNPDENAVCVLTYHAAKGLEWPVVFLADLGSPREASVFGATVESSESSFDPWEPLKGRSIRLWPWPYGSQEKGVYLDATAGDSDEMAQARARNDAENVRLLYVGATRARDYLIFACREKKNGTAWIDALQDGDGRKILTIPAEEGAQRLSIGGSQHEILVRRIEPLDKQLANALASESPAVPVKRILLEAGAAVQHEPLRVQPSAVSVASDSSEAAPADAGADDSSGRVISLGSRLPFAGSPDMAVLGEVVHRFLSADDAASDLAERSALACDILRRWRVTELEERHLIEASNRLTAFLNKRYPGHRLYREWPVHGRLGLQRVSGRIDLLVETDDGYVVVDHKTFPGPHERWVGKAYSYRPQLRLYADLVKNATGRDILALYVHMPIVGKIVDVM